MDPLAVRLNGLSLWRVGTARGDALKSRTRQDRLVGEGRGPAVRSCES